MYSNLKYASIKGIAAAVPTQKITNEHLAKKFPGVDRTAKLAGVEYRRRAPDSVCTSDLCFIAGKQILEDLSWDSDSIDGLIFISQTSDYLLPATSYVLHKRLNLSKHAMVLDINLGCSGYIYGLFVINCLIQAGKLKRVLLLCGDTNSKIISPEDMGSQVLFGDAGTATCIEYSETAEENHFLLGADGSKYNALIMRNYGFRNETAPTINNKGGVDNLNPQLHMDGSQVYSFALTEVPKMIKQLLDKSNTNLNSIDYFFFHQANQYMLNNIISKANIKIEKCPMNIKEFGNTNSASLPLLIVSENKKYNFDKKNIYTFMAGFGVGLSWGGILINLNKIKISDLIEYNHYTVL